MHKKTFVFFMPIFFVMGVTFASLSEWVVPQNYLGYQLEGQVLDYDIVSYVDSKTKRSVELSIITKGSDLYLSRVFKNDKDEVVDADEQKLTKEDDWYKNWMAYKSFDFCE